jgi:hypothetical protein
VVTSDTSALSSKLRDQRSRKGCHNKLHSALNLWPGIRLPSIRLHNIRLHGIRLHGIKPHGIRFLNINGINNDLFLPIRMANPRKKNQRTT